MSEAKHQSDVIVVGGGIAGVSTCLELLERGRKVLLLDRDVPEKLGGLAWESFGGMFFVDSPVQRRAGIKDSTDLAWQDWRAFAEFEERESWPVKWAEAYVHRCTEEVFHWLRPHGVKFFPVVHWVERGLFQPGNSVPRFHLVWGTGYHLTHTLVENLKNHARASTHLSICFRYKVERLLVQNGTVVGVAGVDESTGRPFEAYGEAVVVASGGINGSIEQVRRHWDPELGRAPEVILNGAHPFADGTVHWAAEAIGASVTHLQRQWNYAAGIHHPHPQRPAHGLSLVPPKSALWLNWRGERIGPVPLVSGYDTRYLVERICRQERSYSWQLMNWKIAVRELAVSGSEHNPAIRDRRLFAFLKTVLLGNKTLVKSLLDECSDIVAADSLEELVEKMNALTGEPLVDLQTLRQEVERYDQQIARGPTFHNDEQLRRIAHLRRYRGDRTRTCRFQPILDPRARPLIASREFILSRKSLGGIQTDLQCRVLDTQGKPIPGLFAVGESAGFGGGGMHGKRALEGTFLGGCIFSGRIAGKEA